MSKKKANKTMTNPLVIGKELGRFTVDKKEGPQMYLDLRAMEEKASRVSEVLGVTLTAEQVALFTFLHEMSHYKQWKQKKISYEDFYDTSFYGSARHTQLEVEADDDAVKFIKETGLGKSWKKYTLKSMIGAKREITLEEARELGIIR